MHEIFTEKGVKGIVILPDSTKVWLNSGSRLIYPSAFASGTRDVIIYGEGYFEVTKDSLHPMIVNTGKNFSIEVLGTSFNVKSYEDDRQVEATLYAGEIKARFMNWDTSEYETVILKPNESFIYDNTGTSMAKSKEYTINKPFSYDKPQMQKAWKDGYLVFDNTSMPEVLKKLERWHGTKFIIKNEKIYDYKLSAQFSSESIVQILEIMKLIMPIEYSYKNNTVTLF